MILKVLTLLCMNVVVTECSYNLGDVNLYVTQFVNSTLTTVYNCPASTANFGAQLLNGYETLGCGLFVDPILSCGHVKRENGSHCFSHVFPIAKRGNCSFAQKAYYAERLILGEESIVIIIDNQDGTPIIMSGDDVYSPNVDSAVIMVSQSCGDLLMTNFTHDKGYNLAVRVDSRYDIVKYLWPFVAVTAICFVIMLGAMGVKWVRDRRRRNRRRLSRRNLRKIPTKKYKKIKGEEPETCPICLDDFENGEKIRVLPCKHIYHSKCVDPWLTKNRKVCPVCKRKVLPGDADSSDSENDVEPNTSNESAPLIPSALQNDDAGERIGNSTFYPARYESNAIIAALTIDSGEQQLLSPPSSPEPTSSSGARPAAVRGFVSAIGERVRPSENGVQNEAYENDDEQQQNNQNAKREKRKRHFAPGAVVEPCSLLSSEEEADLDDFGGQSSGVELNNRQKKNKIRSRRKRKSVAASAPPNLDSMVSIDELSLNEQQNSNDILTHIVDLSDDQ